MFDQPVAMVLVASSTDDNPVQCFDRLARSDNLPLVYVLWRVGGEWAESGRVLWHSCL